MGGYYINVNIKTNDSAAVRGLLTTLFTGEGFQPIAEASASAVTEDEDKLPDGDGWYGVLISGASGKGWVSVYVEDWQDSGFLAKRLSQAVKAPVLETWVADDTHWGYNYYENGEVRDRFTDDPSQVAEGAEEAALYQGDADRLAPVLQVPSARFAALLQEARAGAVLVELLDAETAFYVDIEDGVLASGPDALDFGLERTIEGTFVHFFPLNKFVVANFVLKVLNGDEMIVFAIDFGTPAAVAGTGRNGKAQLGQPVHEAVHDGGFTSSRGGRKHNDFALHRAKLARSGRNQATSAPTRARMAWCSVAGMGRRDTRWLRKPMNTFCLAMSSKQGEQSVAWS